MIFSWLKKANKQLDVKTEVPRSALTEVCPSYVMTHRWGAQSKNFPLGLLGKFYDELLVEDDEHPDISLKHESEWVLSAFSSGLLTFENIEGEGSPQHMKNQSKEDVVRLWELLAKGEFDKLNAEDWSGGYS